MVPCITRSAILNNITKMTSTGTKMTSWDGLWDERTALQNREEPQLEKKMASAPPCRTKVKRRACRPAEQVKKQIGERSALQNQEQIIKDIPYRHFWDRRQDSRKTSPDKSGQSTTSPTGSDKSRDAPTKPNKSRQVVPVPDMASQDQARVIAD